MRYRTRLSIDLNLLADNYQLLKKICKNNEVLFMVKAEGYGHGLLPIVRFAASELKIKEFGCATLGEARLLREELADLDCEIYVFSDVQIELPRCSEIYLNRRVIPVLSSIETLEFVLKSSDFKFFPLVLKFNTGMNRLGLDYLDVEKVIKLLKAHGRQSINHLITHFACSASIIDDQSMTALQYNRFKDLKKIFQASGINIEKTSVSNSGAIEQGFGLEESHVRPGIMMYGPTCLNADLRSKSMWTGKNISKLETYIIHTLKIKKGMPVGYGARTVTEDGIVAYLALGYGDGFSTRYDGATLTHNGHRGYIFGRVNMDMAQVFFPQSAVSSIKTGEQFEIWNHDTKSILDFSDQTKTIPYELICSLTSRVPRHYQYKN
jgi:alanine racemase